MLFLQKALVIKEISLDPGAKMARCKYRPCSKSNFNVALGEERLAGVIVAIRHCCVIELEHGVFLQPLRVWL